MSKFSVIFFIIGIVLFKNITNTKAAYIPATSEIQVYNGEVAILQEVKIWTGTVVPSTATNQSVDLSSAGFENVYCVHIMPQHSDNNPIWCTVVSMNDSEVLFNIYEPSTNLITLLGASVLSGSPVVAADNLENMSLHITVMGN